MKRLFVLPALVLALAACGNENEEPVAEAEHEDHSHEHDHALDMDFSLDNDAQPSVLAIELQKDDEPYEADRVRFEITDEGDEDEVEWVDAEAGEQGVYSAPLEGIESGTYSIVAHINGPDDLHEHTEEVFEIE